ncbi:MAG: hypothetical protein ACR2OZ_12640 [Verrucomicrobiales bacterium]
MADAVRSTRPEVAWEFVQKVPAGEERKRHLRHFFNQSDGVDPDRAIEFAQSLEWDERHEALDTIVTRLVHSDLQTARRWAEQLAGEDSPSFAYFAVARTMAEADGEEALKWAQSLPARARSHGIAAACRGWAESIPLAPRRRQSEIENLATRRAAGNEVAGVLAQRSPDEAESWAAALPPEATDT